VNLDDFAVAGIEASVTQGRTTVVVRDACVPHLAAPGRHLEQGRADCFDGTAADRDLS
jgi:hypothetical protein